ncbi:beta-glucosidase [Levilactobacillus bambusae]|uniref:Glycosyl hydrolase n=1 Tax=Levilactobacillus bambusae TaxID=2024736 RepID=A0A2V1N180_9LACO|nr:glycoside hydrolase family 3 C-terminal domain-containing protein [Levilactobacillus bambusae]PWG00145.1 glycosyl hydrolase [Levilactobacillus bambusae]
MDINKTLSELTLTEKAALVSGKNNWYTAKIDRLGIHPLMMTDGPSGLRKVEPGKGISDINDSVPAVCFPAASLTANSFNRDLFFQLGALIGEEARSERVSLVLGPGVNMKRTPAGGRNFEYLSEDPLLTGVLGAEYVKGVQSQNVGVAVKHFAANNRENQRFTVSSDVSERTLRELYLRAFEIIVKTANPDTLMISYNKINGTLNTQNYHLITDVLRDEWGYQGATMSDWGGVADHTAAIRAGLDLEMPGKGQPSTDEIVLAVKTGKLDEGALDNAIRRLLTIIDRRQPDANPEPYDQSKHHEAARKMADESIVLLRNTHNELPLDLAKGTTAIIGQLADKPRFQGGGSSHVNPVHLVTPLDAANQLSDHVIYQPGYDLDQLDTEPTLEAAALEAAKQADHVVVFLGYPESWESEGFDKTSLQLPDNQSELLSDLTDVNDHITVVLETGAPVEMPWVHDVNAIVETYLAGEAVGEATWDILTGAVNPSGHLAETFPVLLSDTPMSMTFDQDPNHEIYSEGIFMGYRFYNSHEMRVLYPFGYGLSYTAFEYTHLQTEIDDEKVQVTFNVTNTGERTGQAVPQLYVANHATHRPVPATELRNFAKVALKAGETKTVTFTLTRRDFSWYRTGKHMWEADSGDYELMIGASSRDTRLQQRITLTFENEPHEISENTYLNEIISDPTLMALFMKDVVTPFSDHGSTTEQQLFTVDQNGKVAILQNPLFTNMPLRALVAQGLPNQLIQTFIRHANNRE